MALGFKDLEGDEVGLRVEAIPSEKTGFDPGFEEGGLASLDGL